MHKLYTISIYVITILLCSILFYNNSELANSQFISGFIVLQDIIVICALCAIISSWKNRIQYNLMDYGIGIFILIGTLNVETISNPDSLKLLLLGIVYFFLRIVFAQSEQAIKMVGMLLIITGIIECWIGFRQLYGFTNSNHSKYLLTGSFFNPGPYCGFLVTILPIALYWMLKTYPQVEHFTFRRIPIIVKSPKERINHIVFLSTVLYIAATFMLLPAGMSRSAWIAGIAGCLVVLVKRYTLIEKCQHYIYTYRKRSLIYGTIILLLISGAGTGMYLMKKDSADGRMLMWKVSWLAMKEHPWTGAGAGHFSGAYGKAQAAYFASGKGTPQEEWVAGSPGYGFNEYLQIGLEFGIIGIIVFLGITGQTLYHAAKSKIEGSNGIIGALVSMLIFALFSYPFRVLSLCILFIILLTLAGQQQEKIKKQPDIHKFRIHMWITRSLSLCLFILSLWLTKDKKDVEEAYIRWAEEKSYFHMDIFEGTADNYQTLYPRLKNQPEFLFEYGQCLSKTGKYAESNRILYEGTRRSADPMLYNIIGKNYQAMKNYDKAEEAFQQASQMVPHRLYPLYLMANMYFESGQTDKAIAMANRIIEKEPKIMSTAVKEMKEQMALALKQIEK